MLPVQLDVTRLSIAVVGRGAAAARKVDACDAAGATRLAVWSDRPGPVLAAAAGDRLVARLPDHAALAGADLVFVAGLDDSEAAAIAGTCRALKVLFNTEDRKPHCDFHLPSLIRRGDLTVAVSTNGRSPALAAYVRRFIERAFGPAWADHLDEVAARREAWRAAGDDMPAVKRRTQALIEDRGWLK